jgi:glycosyltransferase involved in cell wall biosynthesis
MKLIVQIPCFNEEATLPMVLNSIPLQIPGIDKVETLIVDDGSSDKTVKVAKKYGVNHIIKHRTNKGWLHHLQAAFMPRLKKARIL